VLCSLPTPLLGIKATQPLPSVCSSALCLLLSLNTGHSCYLFLGLLCPSRDSSLRTGLLVDLFHLIVPMLHFLKPCRFRARGHRSHCSLLLLTLGRPISSAEQPACFITMAPSSWACFHTSQEGNRPHLLQPDILALRPPEQARDHRRGLRLPSRSPFLLAAPLDFTGRYSIVNLEVRGSLEDRDPLGLPYRLVNGCSI
jgi:hypothetical protein